MYTAFFMPQTLLIEYSDPGSGPSFPSLRRSFRQGGVKARTSGQSRKTILRPALEISQPAGASGIDLPIG
jgi:hypothetical protein